MKNRTLVIVLVLSSLLLGSCLFGIRGNGKVVKSEREVGACRIDIGEWWS